jgi:hypothetical protein
MLQESENSFAAQVLARLAQKYGFQADSALANHLGVTRQTISNWRTRDTLDYKLLLERFPDADLNWLFRGMVEAYAVRLEDAIKYVLDAGYRVEKTPGEAV